MEVGESVSQFFDHSPLQGLSNDSSFPVWKRMIRMQQEWECPIELPI